MIATYLPMFIEHILKCMSLRFGSVPNIPKSLEVALRQSEEESMKTHCKGIFKFPSYLPLTHEHQRGTKHGSIWEEPKA